jgi:hypothetical protein
MSRICTHEGNSNILQLLDPLLGNDSKIRNYKKPLLSNGSECFHGNCSVTEKMCFCTVVDDVISKAITVTGRGSL